MKLLCCIFVLMIGSLLVAQSVIIRIDEPDEELLFWLTKEGFDIASYRPAEYVDVITERSKLVSFESRGYRAEIIQTEAEVIRQLRSAIEIDGYRDYDEVLDDLNSLVDTHENIARIYNLGDSWGKIYYNEGLNFYEPYQHEIWAVKVTADPDSLADKPAVFYFGGYHAREPLSVEVAITFLEYILDNYGDDDEITFLVDNTEIWFLPLVNPDGHKIVLDEIDIWWRKNIRDNNENGQFDSNYSSGQGVDGVDLNRNHSFGWEYSTNTTAATYGGPNPFSEPEVSPIADLFEQRNFVAGISYHTYGELVLHSYSYDYNTYTPDHDALSDLATNVAEAIPTLDGYGHYTPQISWQLYPSKGNLNDYAYGVHGIFSFTVELATQFIPPAAQINQVCQDNIEGAMVLLRRVHNSTLTGHITDMDGEALEAEVFVHSVDDTGDFRHPIESDETFGRYYRMLLPDTYSVTYSAFGYDPVTIDDIVITADENTIVDVQLEAAPLVFLDAEVDDSLYGNDDGIFDPGETVEMIVTYTNAGTETLYNLEAELFCDSPYIIIDEPNPVALDSIAPEAEESFVFTVSASLATPDSYIAAFEVTAEADAGFSSVDSFDIRIGGYIIEEYFDEWLPEGWEVTSTGANVNWQQNNSNNAGGEEPEARFYWSPSTDATQRLISPEINTSGSESIDLEFKHYNNDFSGGYTLKLETSGDGGDTWTEVMVFPSTDFGPELEEITIDNDDVGSDQFRIAWTFDGDSWNINWWCIDDVIVGGVSTYEVAYFEGHVSLSGGNGDLTNVLVTAGDQMGYCDEDGFYSLAVLEGTYEITATLDDYVPMAVEDVSIAVGDTITVDFELEYITPPANLEYDLDFHEVTLMWEDAEVTGTDRAGRLSSSNQQLSASRERLTREQSRPLTHFNIYRSYEEDDFEMIGTSEETTYIDELDEGGYYQYYVTAVYNEEYESEPSNTIEIDVVDAGDDPIPMVTELSGNYPNPFNPETTISYSLKSEEHVVIDIYNIRGQKVKTLVDEQQATGYHSVVWNGRDSNDRSVASGVYFSRMQAGEYKKVKKMLLIK